MAKYNYDKSKLKGLTPFPFLGEVKTRTKHIEAPIRPCLNPFTIPTSLQPSCTPMCSSPRSQR